MIITRLFTRKNIFSVFVFIIILQLQGCKPTRWVQDGDYLVQKNKIEIDNKTIDKKELEGYYRQVPNRRFIVFFKFHLATYNFSKLGKERKWKKWMRTVIGEEPSVYDSVLVERTKEQFAKFLKNEAFYNASVKTETRFENKRAYINYTIHTGNPLLINQIEYQVKDSNLLSLVFYDSISTFLKVGDRMTVKSLENERKKIVTTMRDSGYFDFGPDNINYTVDTVTLPNRANIILTLRKAVSKDSLNQSVEVPHKRFWINNVIFMPDFDPQKALRLRDLYFQTFDTTYYKGYGFLYPDKINVKPKSIFKANTIYKGNRYNFSEVNSTIQYLNSLRIFRLNNINFYKESSSDSLLNCELQLTPAVYQDFSVNFETTNTQGNLGLGGYVNYQHKNLFKGAEIFNFRVSGSLQRQSETSSNEAFNIYEYGATASLETPSFILPFKMQRFYQKYKPKTTFSLLYNYQKRPDYTRVIYGTSMGYNWRGSENLFHIISPIDISSVYVDATQEFTDSIAGTYLENSYKDYLIAGANYSLFYKNKATAQSKSFSYYRLNLGTAGNLLHFLHQVTNYKDTVEGGYFTIFDLQYAQFFLTDFDYRFNQYITKNNSIIYRAFSGVAVPYGNATAIPFVKQYYAGGAEGIRAWHPRDLGPGSYTIPDSLNTYPNQTADIKIEFNMEYRYSLNRNWKGALFVDVGNIWSIKDDGREGGVFDFTKFYKQFAVGTGFGIRYDMDFAVFRFDWGIQVRDPALGGSDSWVLFNTPFIIKDDIIWHFAVGYPF